MKGTDPTCDGTGPHKVKSHTPQMLCKKLSANIWGCTIFRGEWWAFFFFSVSQYERFITAKIST